MAENLEETRLDQLWHAVVADGGAESCWLRFYEGFAAQRLIVPIRPGTSYPTDIKPVTVTLETGEVALAFDTEVRFTTFIASPTEFISLTGAELACAITPMGIGVALNPGVAPGETMLDAQALAWIAKHSGARVELAAMPGDTRIQPLVNPEAPLLEALAIRLSEMTGHIAEAWLAGSVSPDSASAYLCVLCPCGNATTLAPDIAADLTRIGQIRTSRFFSVTVAELDSTLLASARRLGIGLAV